MVPSEFTDEEVDKTRKFIIKSVHDNSRFVNGKVLGNPYVFYKDIAALLGYSIESEHDGDRMGYPAGMASEIEFNLTGLVISAVVVSQEYRRPGTGFYEFSERMGLFNRHGKKADPDGIAELTFWNQHVGKIVERYGKK